MIEPDDILTGWKTMWDADASLPTLVPGSLWTTPVPAERSTPYATATAKADNPQWTTGTAYLQKWTLEVKVWSTAGAVDAGAITQAMNAAFTQATKSSLSIASATKVVHLLQLPGEFARPDGRKDRKESLVTTARWELLLQGVR